MLNPFALSVKVISSSELTILSSTKNPTLQLGVLEYCSNNNISSLILTKFPLKKYTPFDIEIADPIDVEFSVTTLAKGSSIEIKLLPNWITLSVNRISPFTNSHL